MSCISGGRIVAVVAFVLALTSFNSSSAAGQQRTNLFDYDRSITFDLKEDSSRDQDGVTIRDLNYAPYNAAHGRVAAYIVRPKGRGHFAGVLFFHWLGSVNSNRNEFLAEAIDLAKHGAVSLLIQGNFPWKDE